MRTRPSRTAWAQWHAGDRAQRRGGARGVSAARLPREVAQGGAVMTRRASRRRRLSLACALILCSAVALGGCATFGGNIRGDFSCAPPAGLCAPSSTTDDRERQSLV